MLKFLTSLSARFPPSLGGGIDPATLGLRNRGDEQRDRRDWHGAVTAYAAYLDAAPRDFDIWVQLGHSHKEAGNLPGARAAYARAQQLRDNDADLLLNVGHLHRLEGDLAAAARSYADSARLAETPGVREALHDPAIIAHLTEADRNFLLRATEQKTRTMLDARCTGLRTTGAASVHVGDDDLVRYSTDDPWVAFELDRRVAQGRMAGILVIQLAEDDVSRAQSGKVYIDWGTGLSERDVVAFAVIGSNRIAALLIVPAAIATVRWDLQDEPGTMRIQAISFRALTDAADLIRLFRTDERPLDDPRCTTILGQLFGTGAVDSEDAIRISAYFVPGQGFAWGGYRRVIEYASWIRQYATPDKAEYQLIADADAALALRPRFSFVLPTYNPPVALLEACITSILTQTYRDFELCVADDCSTDPAVIELLRGYAAREPQMKLQLRRRNGHISAASNSALALATGDFIVLVDHDDLIPDFSLSVIAHYINRYPDADVFFSDEDKIDEYGRRFDPYFKGNFDRFLMYGHNMVSHLGIYRRTLLTRIGGFRQAYEGSQDYDLLLRCSEVSGDERIIHIPHVLYHWRAIAGSTALSPDQKSYAIVAAQRSIDAHFSRQNIPLASIEGFAPGVAAIAITSVPMSKVSIIIPTRNGVDLLRACIGSIDRHDPEQIELIVVDNGSDCPETLAYLNELASRDDTQVLIYPDAFNFSLINNFAAQHASGDILCFLNNDTEVIAATWLDRARALMALDEVGVLGARLLYPDGSLQHFGITLGMGEHRVAGALHSGLSADLPGYFGKARLIQQFSAVTAACMFVRAHDFKELGGFSAELRVAYNDVDYCLRVRERGARVVCDPEILLIHKESRTRGSDEHGEQARRLDAEAALMRDRWGSILDNDPFFSPNLSLDTPDCALAFPPRVQLPWRTP